MRIVAASITPLSIGPFDPVPAVLVKLEDGSEKLLFRYYPDELSVTADEVVGLTDGEALDLEHRKDVACLRS
jgi:hypothetical protein